MVRENCFAFISKRECSALKNIDCKKCKFYKPKTKIVNNVFYAWSYKDKRQYLKEKEEFEKRLK